MCDNVFVVVCFCEVMCFGDRSALMSYLSQTNTSVTALLLEYSVKWMPMALKVGN